MTDEQALDLIELVGELALEQGKLANSVRKLLAAEAAVVALADALKQENSPDVVPQTGHHATTFHYDVPIGRN